MRSFIMDSNACKEDIEKGEWQKMMNAAHEKRTEIERQKMTQVIVVLTANEKIYTKFLDYGNKFVQEEEEHFLDTLKATTDTEVKKMVCMWSEGSLDFPAYSLREKLIQINPQNESAEILLNGYDGFIVKTVDKTMKS